MKLPRWIRPARAALAGVALLLLATGCAGYIQPAGEGTVFLSFGPPPQQREERPPSPGNDYAWINGQNQWNGNRYDWTPGRWERRPQPHAKWVDGRWNHEKRGWYHSDGHWKN